MPAPRGLAKHVRSAPLESVADLAAALCYAREHAERVGRSAPLALMFAPMLPGYAEPGFDADAYVAASAGLAELGVGYAGVSFAYPGRSAIASRARFLELAEGFARDVVERCRAL